MLSAEPTVTHNPGRRRFELLTDGKLSIITYVQPDAHTLALVHTEVHPDLEGQGVGSRLVAQTLAHAEANGLKIVPLCPFIAAYVKRHPDWQPIVSTKYSLGDF
jgi:uncharacterized protein